MTSEPPAERRDDRVRLPLEPEEALRGLLAVDPDAPPTNEEERDPDKGA